ncbi:hypothetical protein [Streptomyces qinzhouensis]|uniref:hypothetical protein n=1 Tax=Streptomyces qinzhouensis TaxID=2599401 RepID=UPI0016456861|nr:hypothetical protein [Streptomyces qinzhouensis]
MCRTSQGVTVVAALPRASGPDRELLGCPAHAARIRTAAERAIATAEATLRMEADRA